VPRNRFSLNGFRWHRPCYVVDVPRTGVYDRSMRRRGRDGVVVRALLAALCCAPGAAPAAADGASLAVRLHRIESAFREGDAPSLRRSFTRGRVRLDLRDLTDGPGAYGPGQLQAMFGRIFEQGPTREFTFRDGEVTRASPDTAFARGRWVRGRPGGADCVDNLTFTLHEESGDWRILEIRSSR
jgi:hypothetical protein